MNRSHSFGLAAIVLSAAFVVAAANTHAQPYPSKPIRIVVAYPPGGGTDVMARVVAKQLGSNLGQPIVIENRGGANATIGTNNVAKSAPDGYSLAVVSGTPFVINQVVFKDLPYNVLTDFEPIGLFTNQPLLLLVNPSLPVNTTQELVSYAKSKKDFTYAGTDQFTFLTMEMIRRALGVEMIHVPYKGGGPAITDVIGGHVPALLGTVGVALPHVQAGKLKAIAITSAERSPVLPNVPALAEGPMPGFDVGAWFGLMAPKGTPPAILDKLNAALSDAVNSPEVKERLIALGGDTRYLPPAQFRKFLEQDLQRWTKAAEQAGVTPQPLQ